MANEQTNAMPGKLGIEYGYQLGELMDKIKEKYEAGWDLKAMAHSNKDGYVMVFVKVGDE